MKMFPAHPRANANRSERRLFDAFAAVGERRDWLVVHSAHIGTSSEALHGETDFYVFAPGLGILTVEAKAPKSVYRTAHGEWFLEGTPKPTKSPLEQADRAVSAMYAHLKRNNFPENIPMPRLIWFTSLERHKFDVKPKTDFEFFEWELGWESDLKDPVRLVEKVFSEQAKRFGSSDKVEQQPELFTLTLAEEAVSSLFSQFNISLTPAEMAKVRKGERDALFEEQALCLDQLELNKHIYFEGVAGTGKSRLLEEVAKRSRKQDKRTVFTCWNNMMAEEHSQRFTATDSNLVVKSLNRLMLDFAGFDDNPPNAEKGWYETKLPKLAIAGVKQKSHLARFSTIICDEFQDLVDKPEVIRFMLNLARDHEPKNSEVILAGDDNQMILVDEKDGRGGYEVARQILPDLVRFQLVSNWRMNPKLFADMQNYLNLQLPIKRHLLEEDISRGLSVIEVEDGDEFKVLREVLLSLLEQYQPEDIRILSPFGSSSLAARVFESQSTKQEIKWLKQNLRHESGKGKIRWRSIPKFKGLEQDAVVITDIGPRLGLFSEEKLISETQLMYTALSRARHATVIIVDAS